MSALQARQGAGISFCWQCGKQLQRAPGKGLGLFYFHLVEDQDGRQHRVHGFPCLSQAKADGLKFVPVQKSECGAA